MSLRSNGREGMTSAKIYTILETRLAHIKTSTKSRKEVQYDSDYVQWWVVKCQLTSKGTPRKLYRKTCRTTGVSGL